MGTYAKLLEAAQKNDTLSSLTPLFIEWKKDGQCIVGKFLSKNSVKSSLSDGTYNQYVFETDGGLVKFALGSAADADFGNTLRAGNVYLITYAGKVKIGQKRHVNKFTVDLVAEASELAPTPSDDIPF